MFKYGSIHINKEMERPFNNIDQLCAGIPIIEDSSFNINEFEYSFEYLFIHFTREGWDNSTIVNIADIQGVYPLDEEAKKELSISLDKRIEIKDPLWPDAVRNLQKKNALQNCQKGVKNIWNIYGLKDSIEEMTSFITNEVINEVIDELFNNRRPEGDLSIWVYIMRYERHGYYPKNTIGAFMDAVHAICNHKAKKETDSAVLENTGIMKFLQKLNEEDFKINFDDILKKLNEEQECSIFMDHVKKIGKDVSIINTAVLFYLYRDRYKEVFSYEPQWVENGKKNGKEFSVTCYMLGCILGHEHTYDCLYERLPLSIFKHSDVDSNVKVPKESDFTKEKQPENEKEKNICLESTSHELNNLPQKQTKELESRNKIIDSKEMTQEEINFES